MGPARRRPSSLFYAVETLEVGDRELQISLALVFVAVQREGEVDAAAMLLEERGALGSPPRHRPEAAALLVEGHFQVSFLDRAGPVDDLDGAGVEDRTRVG